MFKDRRQWIGDRLKEVPFLPLSELKEQFPDVSEMTLRRDIEYFEKLGDAIKVHGGARSTQFVTTQTDDPYLSRLNDNIRAKIKIAKTAAGLLSVGRSIFMDSGSTVQQTVQFIPNERFTFTTTGPQTALELCRIGLPVVNLVGGKLDRDYQAVTGMQALRFLADINIDTALMCASGFSAGCGFTGGNSNECELKRTVIKKARQVIMLLDSSKFDRSLPYTFASLSDIDCLICDSPLPDGLFSQATAAGVEIITAD